MHWRFDKLFVHSNPLIYVSLPLPTKKCPNEIKEPTAREMTEKLGMLSKIAPFICNLQ